MNALTMAVADGATIARRNAIKIKRNPDILGLVVMTPIMFVLLFAYVFGSQIDIPGMSYKEYMLPGIFVQTAIFGATLSGYGLVEDLRLGIIDRFRSLPMAPSAVLVGRTVSDVIANVVSIVAMAAVGLLIGWRIDSTPPEALLAFVVLLLFGYALSWMTSTIALLIRTTEVYNNAVTMAIFPLVFISNTFVDSDRLPGPLKVIAEWNPTSAVTQAARELFGNTSPQMAAPDAWPLQHPVPASLIWIALIMAVFVPLATWRYKKAVSR